MRCRGGVIYVPTDGGRRPGGKTMVLPPETGDAGPQRKAQGLFQGE
jgi:hypothetical protein